MNFIKHIILGPQRKVPASKCLGCGLELTNASTVNHHDRAPQEGHMTVCSKCGHVMAFRADLSLREITPAEAMEIVDDPRVASLQLARLRRMI